jgi:hypothetical protein
VPALLLGLAASAAASSAPPAALPHAPPERAAERSSGPTRSLPSDAALVRMGAVIGRIEIHNRNVFDLSNPKDDRPLFRLADRLHRTTRKGLIRHQLLFHTGERYSPHLLAESARILRADPYFYDASIRPIRYHDGKVDVLVSTRDVWTLNPGFDFSRSGGKSSVGFQLEELNALGTGTDIKLAHMRTVDRTESTVDVSNQHVFDTWTAVDAAYGNLSDGRLRQLIVNRPFYALETRHAGGVSLIDTTFDNSLYDLGHIIDKFHERDRQYQIYGGWSQGLVHGWTRRYSVGLTYDEHRFGPAPATAWSGPVLLPRNRKFVYPWVQFDLVQDEYVKLRNHNQIDRTEDFHLGAYLNARAGWAPRSFGSSRNALMLRVSSGDGYSLGRRDLLLVAGAASGRIERGTLENGLVSASLTNFDEQSSHWLLYSALTARAGRRLALDNQILLGGDNGLRGYPLRYQDGTASALFTIEERWFSDWYPLRLFRVGAAVFFDMGRTWGRPPLAAPSLGLLKDAGFGLRFGNARTAFGNVIHVDLAFPFNGGSSIKRVQFLVTTHRNF